MNANEKTNDISNAPETPPIAPPKKRWSDETVGFCSSLCSAACYSVSLISLRALTDYPEVDPDWTIAMKELTTVVCVLPFIVVQAIRGRWKFPGFKALGILIAAGIACQVFGARPHLIAYSAIGIALATPLIQAIQLIGTTAFGAIWLREKVSKIKIASIIVSIAAVWLLSASQNDGGGQIAGQSMRIGLGLLCVVCVGLGYSTQLSLMRKVLRLRDESGAEANAVRTPTSLAMVAVTGVGFVVCAAFLTAERGVGAFFEPAPICWAFALTSGVANMTGFYFQIESLRRLYASKASLVAASQTLVLSILGIVFFAEPLNAAVVCGLILVALGVALAGFSK